MVEQYTWTNAYSTCINCNRRFRVALEVLNEQREMVPEFDGATNQAIAESLEYCIECVSGEPVEGEHVVPEIREVEGGAFEARGNTDAWWESLTKDDAKGLGDLYDAMAIGEWGDGNALVVTAHKFKVPVELVLNRVGAWHPSADCACDLCEADRLDIQVTPQARDTIAVSMNLGVAHHLNAALDVVLDGAPEEVLASLMPLRARLGNWLSGAR